MWEYGDLKTRIPMWSVNVTLLKSMCLVQSPVKKCMVHSSLLKKPLLAWHLDMLQLWPMPQLQNIPTFISQQDGSPAHFHCEVRQYLNAVLPERWIGRASGNDQPLMLWPQRSPDINPVIFSLEICQRPCIRPTIATWPKGTDPCSSEEYRCTHVDTCGKNLNIVSMCAVSPWCTHRTYVVVKKKKKLFQFPSGCEQFH